MTYADVRTRIEGLSREEMEDLIYRIAYTVYPPVVLPVEELAAAPFTPDEAVWSPDTLDEVATSLDVYLNLRTP